MIVTRRGALGLIGGGALAGTVGSSAAWAQGAQPQIGVVVKIGGIPWFNAMEMGIKKAAKQYNANAWMIGPTQADAAQQVRAVEDLIARKVDVIGIVPNDAAALEPVCQRARAAGIKVLTHESPDQKGERLGLRDDHHRGLWRKAHGLAGAADGRERQVHRPTWARSRSRCTTPGPMRPSLIRRTNIPRWRCWATGSASPRASTTVSRPPRTSSAPTRTSKGSSPSARRARSAAPRRSTTAARPRAWRSSAVSRPARGQKYVKSGIIRGGYIWNPLTAGEVFVQVATLLAAGKQPTDGMDITDVGPVHVDATKRLIQAQKLESLDKENIDRLVALGL